MGVGEMYIDCNDMRKGKYILYWEDSKWKRYKEAFNSKKILLERLNNLLEENIYRFTITRG